MPVTSVDAARAQLQEPVSIREVDAAASNRDLQVLQTSSPLATSTWGLLDSAFFAKRPDVELRVYGFHSGTCDLSFASRIRHVARGR
jgi:hypothetical protein